MKKNKSIEKSIISVIKTIYDPEIPIDIYELGLIYDIKVSEKNDVEILMTLTTPNCPVADSLPQEVENVVKSLKKVNNVNLKLTFEPSWNKEMISEEGKFELGMI